MLLSKLICILNRKPVALHMMVLQFSELDDVLFPSRWFEHCRLNKNFVGEETVKAIPLLRKLWLDFVSDLYLKILFDESLNSTQSQTKKQQEVAEHIIIWFNSMLEVIGQVIIALSCLYRIFSSHLEYSWVMFRSDKKAACTLSQIQTLSQGEGLTFKCYWQR